MTIVKSARISAATASIEDHFNALIVWIQNNSIFWDLDDSGVVGNYQHALFSCDDNQIEIRRLTTGAGATLEIRLDHLKAIASVNASSASASDWREICSNPTVNTRAVFSEYPDAMFWCLTASTNNRVSDGFHAGLIMIPFNANDVASGMTGHGILCGIPSMGSGAGARDWLSSSTGPRTFRIPGEWSTDNFRAQLAETLTNGGEVGDRLLFSPYLISFINRATIGFTRYLRRAETSRLCFTVLPSSVTANTEAFLYFTDATAVRPQMALWEKGVTP